MYDCTGKLQVKLILFRNNKSHLLHGYIQVHALNGWCTDDNMHPHCEFPRKEQHPRTRISTHTQRPAKIQQQLALVCQTW